MGFASAELLVMIVPLWLSTLGCYLISEKRPQFTFWAFLLTTGLLSSLLAETLPFWCDVLLLPVSLYLIIISSWAPFKGSGEWALYMSLLPISTLGTVLGNGVLVPLVSWIILPLFGTCAFVTFIGYRTKALPAAVAFWIGCLLVRPIGLEADAQVVLLFSELGGIEARTAVSAMFAIIIAGSIIWSLASSPTVPSVDADK